MGTECHQTGSEEPRRLEPKVVCFQLTTQPSGGIAPVGAYTLGPAECCIGLQALTERVSNIGIAVVTDTGFEEGIWREEPVALGEDPMTVNEWSGLGRAQRAAGQGNYYPTPPPPKDNSLAQHQLTERCRGAWSGGQCAGHCGLGSGAGGRARLR